MKKEGRLEGREVGREGRRGRDQDGEIESESHPAWSLMPNTAT